MSKAMKYKSNIVPKSVIISILIITATAQAKKNNRQTPPFKMAPFVSLGNAPTIQWPDAVMYCDTSIGDIQYYKDSLNLLHITSWNGYMISTASDSGALMKEEFLYNITESGTYTCWCRVKVTEMYNRNGFPVGVESPSWTEWTEIAPNTLRSTKAKFYLDKVIISLKNDQGWK